MKLLFSYLFLFISFGCLYIVSNAEKFEPINILFWTCVFGISICITEKQLKKHDHGKRDIDKAPKR